MSIRLHSAVVLGRILSPGSQIALLMVNRVLLGRSSPDLAADTKLMSTQFSAARVRRCSWSRVYLPQDVRLIHLEWRAKGRPGCSVFGRGIRLQLRRKDLGWSEGKRGLSLP